MRIHNPGSSCIVRRASLLPKSISRKGIARKEWEILDQGLNSGVTLLDQGSS